MRRRGDCWNYIRKIAKGMAHAEAIKPKTNGQKARLSPESTICMNQHRASISDLDAAPRKPWAWMQLRGSHGIWKLLQKRKAHSRVVPKKVSLSFHLSSVISFEQGCPTVGASCNTGTGQCKWIISVNEYEIGIYGHCPQQSVGPFLTDVNGFSCNHCDTDWPCLSHIPIWMPELHVDVYIDEMPCLENHEEASWHLLFCFSWFFRCICNKLMAFLQSSRSCWTLSSAQEYPSTTCSCFPHDVFRFVLWTHVLSISHTCFFVQAFSQCS